jgi:hypothetical protein
VIPKKPAPDLIRSGNLVSEKRALTLDPRDHAQAKRQASAAIQSDGFTF